MLDNTFVFDAVIHVVDWSIEAMKSDASFRDPEVQAEMMRLSKLLTGGVFEADVSKINVNDALKGSREANYDVMFRNAPTDMGIVGSLPFGPGTASDLYADPEHFIKVNHGFAAAYPQRCIFSGGVEPTAAGVDYAKESIKLQAHELGAKMMKFYPFYWKADDRELGYPLYERCQEVGINILQFHMCLPGDASHDVEIQRPNYLQRVARDFPDMQIIIHHPMPLYFDEVVNIAARFKNIHLLISPMVQLSLIRPRLIQKLLGELLLSVGSDRLMYGSEGAVSGNPTSFLRAFKNMQIPEDLQEGYGFPALTDKDKEKILGLNLAKLMNIDVEAKKRELAVLDASEGKGYD
ncbi:amidohydrolase family protein [Burkholderia sp. Ax-1719]|uniref:amidohydrolase family protein n=1 Tax=Burkholderia sp. Ax-1719 TaxID=2608334 RepID=UPI00141DF667|nr:amidohydrolase family protein [Burkholderia sp. Ax-1719]